jgi:hypothetical protein
MSGYVLTRTDLERIPGADDKDWSALEREYPVLRQDGDYMEKIFRPSKPFEIKRINGEQTKTAIEDE